MRARLSSIAAITILLAGCGSSPQAPTKPERQPAPVPAPVRDLTGLLPPAGRISAEVVPDHLLGQPAMPGGTLGQYAAGGRKYQLFIIETDTAQSAALLLVDMKGALQNPAYLPNMGGYFGTAGSKPIFVFAKLRYLAGVAGLPEKEADPIARTLAARLR
jgi:hypothetical protein